MNFNFEKIKDKIKVKFGIADSEIYIILILAVGLLIGGIYKNFFSDIEYQLTNKDELFNTLDSLAEVNKTTFIGSNFNSEPVPALKAADTIIKDYKKTSISKLDFKGIVNINTASSEQLQQLYRISEKTAARIIEFRKKTPFKSKEDIMKVKGIGEATFEIIKDNIEI